MAVAQTEVQRIEHDWQDLVHWTDRQWMASLAADRYGFFLFGGARGPGKSYWLRWYAIRFLIKAFQDHGLRNVRAMLACESFPTLEDRQLSKVETEFPEWLGRYYKGRAREFHLSDDLGGGVLCFRNLDDPEKYKSAEFGLIAVDELTQNPLSSFDILRGSMRWAGLPKAHFVAATNPTGPGAAWVRQYWIERKFPDEYISEGMDREFAFLQGLPAHNPHLPESYWRNLRSLPDILRKAWVGGDWYAGVEGQVFPNFTWDNVSEEAEYDPAKGDVYWFVDDGFAQEHPRVILLAQMPAENVFHIFAEYYVTFEVAEESIKQVLETMGYPKPKIATCDPSAAELSSRLWDAEISTDRPRHMVEEGIKRCLHVICDGHDVRRLLVHPRCAQFIFEMQNYIRDKRGRIIKANDHGPDAWRYGVWSRYRVGGEDEAQKREERKKERVERQQQLRQEQATLSRILPDLPDPPPPPRRGR